MSQIKDFWKINQKLSTICFYVTKNEEKVHIFVQNHFYRGKLMSYGCQTYASPFFFN